MSSREEIAALLGSTDWAATPLGPRAGWPKTLEGFAALVLDMPTPAIVFWGPDLTQIYNAGYAAIMGPRHPRFFGAPYRECWPDTYPTIYPWMRKVLDHGETIQVERTLIPVTRNGWREEAYFTFTFSPMRDDDGKVQGIFQPVLEVTDAVLADRRATTLRLLSKRGDSATADALNALAQNRSDVPFALLYAPSLVRTTGVDESDVKPSVAAHVRRAIEEGVAAEIAIDEVLARPHVGPLDEPTRRAYVLPLEDRPAALVVGISSVLVFDDAYRAFLESLAHEASSAMAYEERHRAEKALLDRERAARAEAETANRMKDEFLATMSHELRTPLNAILGWSSLLVNGVKDEATRLRALGTIERNARAQARLVEDVLDVSRIASGKLSLAVERVEVRTVALAALDVARPAADAKGVRLDVVEDATDPLVLAGDAGRIQQIVWNLLSNAVRYTPAGGNVRLALRHTSDSIEVEVRDTGAGIPAEHLPHVFERFRQVDSSTTRKHGGLGLGLAIVRHLVELHGGTVRAESDGADKGATFTVSFPRRAAPPASREQASRAYRSQVPSSLPLARVRILIVDDAEDSRQMLGAALATAGADVVHAESARAAMERIAASPPDLLVSDIAMPEEDGYSLIESVRRLPAHRGGSVPAIALTAHARPQDRDLAIAAGFQRHFAKPVDLAELVDAAAALARRR